MPTQKQLRATEKIVEKRGNISISKAMLAAGYSAASAKNPKNLTESKGFASITEELQNELRDIKVTPKKLAKVIKQGLAAKQGRDVLVLEKEHGKVIGAEHKRIEVTDHNTRHKYLDTALKIFGAYPAEDRSPTAVILAQFKGMASAYMEDTPESVPLPSSAPIEGEVVDAN